MGVLPSGAYLAKKLLLQAADGSGQWWWEWVLQAGGFLTTSYVVLVVAHAFRTPGTPAPPCASVPRLQEAAALALALCSLALALAAVVGPVPGELLGNPIAPKEIGWTLVTVIGGGVLALMLARRLPVRSTRGLADASPARRATLAAGGVLERIDTVLRHWPVAGLSMLVLALLFGALMATSR